MSEAATGTGAAPIPSATVVLLREAAAAPECLLLQRVSREPDKPGMWVFPGGRVEEIDRGGPDEDPLATVRRTAVRETREESGLDLGDVELAPISRWITPPVTKRRFDTWFFAGIVPRDAKVVVDGSEMGDHRWLAPGAALREHRDGLLRLPPPTFVTISSLAGHETTRATLDAITRPPLITFEPRICPRPDGACVLYPGDAGYETRDTERAGARHRLWTGATGLRYERTGV